MRNCVEIRKSTRTCPCSGVVVSDRFVAVSVSHNVLFECRFFAGSLAVQMYINGHLQCRGI